MSIPLELIQGESIAPPRIKPRSLALIDRGDIILAPHTRYPAIVHVGNGTTFGRVFDRERSCTVMEMEDAMMLRLLVRIIARCLGEGYLMPPPSVQRVGVRFFEKANIYGCFSIDEKGREVSPLVVVSVATEDVGRAIAKPGKQALHIRGETPTEAMLGAVAVFMGHAAA